MVHIRSKDCTEIGGLNTDLVVNLQQPIKRLPGHLFHISISSAEIPCMWYNVCDHIKSNKISIDGGSTVVTLNDQHADVYQLMTQLTDNSDFPFDAEFDISDFKVRLTSTDSGASHTLDFSDDDTKELAKMMGFDREDVSVPAGGFVVSDGVVNMRPIHGIYLHSNLAASNVLTTLNGDTESIIDKIPIGEVGPTQVMNYNPYQSAPFSCVVSVDAISIFRMTLKDQNSRTLNLNGARYELSILIEQRPFQDLDQSEERRSITASDPFKSSLVRRRYEPQQTEIVYDPVPEKTKVETPDVEFEKKQRVDETFIDEQNNDLDLALMLASSLPSV